MKKEIIFILFCILQIHNMYSQKKSIDEYYSIDKIAILIPESEATTSQGIADYIKTNFSSKNDQIRALYAWITNNIEYNVEDMFLIDIDESKNDKLIKVLETKKGICEDYSLLFDEICSLLSIRSYVIDGYTKQNNSIENTPHSWCAAQIDTEWYLFDPTWGAGVVDSNKFIKKINNSYFKVDPSSMIKSHMPFDYLWEFLDYPISTENFYTNTDKQSDTKFYFNYRDSINNYDSIPENDRLISAVNRIQKNGIKNSSTAEYLKTLKLKIENNTRALVATQFNSAISDYNDGAKGLNNFINYRNNKFNPSKSDAEIRDMMDDIFNKFNNAKFQLLEIKSRDTNINKQVVESLELIEESTKVADEQDSWLTAYLKKGKFARKSMFHKVSWFGIPLN